MEMDEYGNFDKILIEHLTVRAPSKEVMLNFLKKIAEEHGLDWDPTEFETELLKPHEEVIIKYVSFRFTVNGKNFTGQIPDYIRNCTSLRQIRLDGNKFSGDISQLFGMNPNLAFINLSGNQLTSEISPDFGKLQNLTNLQMERNIISGNISSKRGKLQRNYQELHAEGARRLAVVGMEAFGCIPLIRVIRGTTGCDDVYNKVALTFNTKIKSLMAKLRPTLGIKYFYTDIYGLMLDIVNKPSKYGFTEASKLQGPTCGNRSKYVYWDIVHFTEEMYKIISEEAIKSLIKTFA
ncbi:SGNH hydrolase-type esterase domain-containing protein [Artemisia annua]|uniref:SGNH hydrolase-type esterase domain-containing protein n=1 Tax=Artemisia annua TaxID=35608 RepID=A0A2U1PWW7_ARTAN|nr:SGNH hydrolase-type esterase domain-containing protein [Artemisia annua]